jgi:hypothetical protein
VLLFCPSNRSTKNEENKIRRGLGGSQTMTLHTTTNKKHPGATKERRDMRRGQRGVQGEHDFIVLGAIKLGGGKK